MATLFYEKYSKLFYLTRIVKVKAKKRLRYKESIFKVIVSDYVKKSKLIKEVIQLLTKILTVRQFLRVGACKINWQLLFSKSLTKLVLFVMKWSNSENIIYMTAIRSNIILLMHELNVYENILFIYESLYWHEFRYLLEKCNSWKTFTLENFVTL